MTRVKMSSNGGQLWQSRGATLPHSLIRRDTVMLSRNSAGETVGEGNFSAQAEQAFKNVQAALESVGSNMHHIMKMNVFMTHREDIPEYRVVRAKFIPEDALPVSTLILCSGLADPVFRIEVEVVATMP